MITVQLVSIYDKNTAFIQVPLVDFGKKNTFYYGTFFSVYGLNMHLPKIEINKILNYDGSTLKIAGFTGACLFFNREIWNNINGFDESQIFNIDDVDLGPRAYLYGFNNILFTKAYFTHLGVLNANNPKIYSNRLKLLFSGHARSMIKNYKLGNLIWHFPVLCLFQLLKAIKYSFKKKSIGIFMAFLSSIKLFIRNLPDTLKQRKIIQSKRVIKEDIFLKIRPPKFD